MSGIQKKLQKTQQEYELLQSDYIDLQERMQVAGGEPQAQPTACIIL